MTIPHEKQLAVVRKLLQDTKLDKIGWRFSGATYKDKTYDLSITFVACVDEIMQIYIGANEENEYLFLLTDHNDVDHEFDMNDENILSEVMRLHRYLFATIPSVLTLIDRYLDDLPLEID